MKKVTLLCHTDQALRVKYCACKLQSATEANPCDIWITADTRLPFYTVYIFYRLRHLGCSDSVIRLYYAKVQITVAGQRIELKTEPITVNPLKERPRQCWLAPETEDKKNPTFYFDAVPPRLYLLSHCEPPRLQGEPL
jgi:hypothetical protein